MTTRIILVRHAETEWNLQGRWQGHADIPLNETGRMQAQALARRLAHWPIDAIYSSDLQRALETARPVAAALGLEIYVTEQWRERDVGDFTGLTSAEIAEAYPDVWGQAIFDPPTGESVADVRERVVAGLQALVSDHPDQAVLVMTHGGVLYSILGHILGLPPGGQLPFTGRANTSISILEAENSILRLATLNDSAHLEGMERG